MRTKRCEKDVVKPLLESTRQPGLRRRVNENLRGGSIAYSTSLLVDDESRYSGPIWSVNKVWKVIKGTQVWLVFLFLCFATNSIIPLFIGVMPYTVWTVGPAMEIALTISMEATERIIFNL